MRFVSTLFVLIGVTLVFPSAVLAYLGPGDRKSNFHVLQIDYKEVLEKPYLQAKRMERFLGRELDVQKMANIVDSRLYRSRRSF